MNEARRRKLAGTMMEPSRLGDVVDAIATFGSRPHAKVYVERRGSGYRWSVAHRGGPYPLLREVARFLDVEPHAIIVPCAAVDGWTIVAPEGPRMPRASAWAFITASADRRAIAKAIEGLARYSVASGSRRKTRARGRLV